MALWFGVMTIDAPLVWTSHWICLLSWLHFVVGYTTGLRLIK